MDIKSQAHKIRNFAVMMPCNAGTVDGEREQKPIHSFPVDGRQSDLVGKTRERRRT